jgi:hypothetical protein
VTFDVATFDVATFDVATFDVATFDVATSDVATSDVLTSDVEIKGKKKSPPIKEGFFGRSFQLLNFQFNCVFGFCTCVVVSYNSVAADTEFFC